MTNRNSPHLADAARGLYHVFVRDLIVPCSIGIYDFEKEAPQNVCVNIDLAVHDAVSSVDDEHENIVCYEKVADGAREIMTRGHINLVETLAEEVAAMCLTNDRVCSVRVRIEKPDILPDAASVGVEIERLNKAK
ncbi:MAG: dihydroneopterin aldolase [Rhodospirillales bacterium]|jgi:7,8-dihydroneopterin aldolase/epimerase/oxygenase|nr:dihydroneopterin aldolase [Rhodospirillales bacterium]MBT3767683.1 dihydroneopterin aldolase [Rhodospirillales bacterium]MBT4038416.1 dihydroneopterin aldolase [Rhodospirillales bacterium]MBT4625715.1 dihydroneopterin aldolase [Rhodospirillales bacterium]MBT5352381.1 dihydroneopterin aldolase [Rhodospirillales bacterium]